MVSMLEPVSQCPMSPPQGSAAVMRGETALGKSGYPVVKLPATLRLSGLMLATAAALSACARGPNPDDPFEATNRRVHDFNTELDRAFLRPAGQLAAAMPPVVREPVSNFADNVALPGMVLNGLLQGNVAGAATNTFRFLINSTWGLLGIADPAGDMGLAAQDTDFGETLAVWGVPAGAYLELPGFGPSTQRDAVGELVDFVIDPLDRLGQQAMTDYGTLARVADIAIKRGTFGDTLDSILYESADSYAQTRLIYLQNRQFDLGQAADDAYVDPYGDTYIDPYEAQQ